MPSGWEWAILVLIALLLFGGSRLPGIGRNAGRAVHTFRDELSAFRSDKTAPSEPVTPAPEAASTSAHESEAEQT